MGKENTVMNITELKHVVTVLLEREKMNHRQCGILGGGISHSRGRYEAFEDVLKLIGEE
jgi:hypothetical protein